MISKIKGISSRSTRSYNRVVRVNRKWDNELAGILNCLKYWFSKLSKYSVSQNYLSLQKTRSQLGLIHSGPTICYYPKKLPYPQRNARTCEKLQVCKFRLQRLYQIQITGYSINAYDKTTQFPLRWAKQFLKVKRLGWVFLNCKLTVDSMYVREHILNLTSLVATLEVVYRISFIVAYIESQISFD